MPSFGQFAVSEGVRLDDVRKWIPRLADLPPEKRASLRGFSSPRA